MARKAAVKPPSGGGKTVSREKLEATLPPARISLRALALLAGKASSKGLPLTTYVRQVIYRDLGLIEET
jgi:hypothetical protein